MLSNQQLAQFEREGYLGLGQVAAAEQVAELQERIDDLMLGRAPNAGIWFQLDSETGAYDQLRFGDGSWSGETLSYRKIERLDRDPLFLAYLQHPVFRDLTSQLIGEEVSIYRAMFMNKPAGRGTHLPYHQ